MPLPHPGPDEAKSAFVSRFMEDARAQAEFPDEQQRLAVAEQKWQSLSKSVLTAAARNKIPHADFAGPDESYPIEDEAHARNALARAAQNGDPALIARVKAAVRKKFPHIMVDGEQASKARRIKAAEITRIALCKQGKNGFTTLLKGDGSFCWETLVKASAARDELLAVVYAPDREDDDGEFASADVIKAAAHAYNRDHRELDIEHDGRPLSNEDAYVAESFIVAKGDERFRDWKGYDGQPVGDLTGAWATVIKLENPALQKAYRDGELDGVSMFGQAALERAEKSAASKRVADRLGKSRDAQEIEMTKEEMTEILSGFKAEMVAMVKSAIAPAKETEAAEATDVAPEFKGDATNPSDLESFEKALRSYELNKSLKGGKLTADKVAELRKALTSSEPSDEEAGVEVDDTPEMKDLRRQLFKAKRRSNAPAAPASGEDSVEAIAKAAADEGRAIASLFNEQRGSGQASGMRLVNKS
jgi:hypothetical protein